MRKILLLLCLLNSFFCYSQEKPVISGRVTDFNGDPVKGAEISLGDFQHGPLYTTLSDNDGSYRLEVAKGTYPFMWAMIENEYPLPESTLDEDDMRLEFWGWNIIADRDLVIDIRYHRLELYGTTVFEIFGADPGYFIYFRPMSLGKNLAYGREIALDKSLSEELSDINVYPENLQVRVYADDEELKVKSLQPITEFTEGKKIPMIGYIAQVSRPALSTDRPYIIFRVVGHNTEHDEWGENVYFYRIPEFLQPGCI